MGGRPRSMQADVPDGPLYCVLFMAGLVLSALLLQVVKVFGSGKCLGFPGKDRFVRWSVARSVDRLIPKTPYTVRYQVDQQNVVPIFYQRSAKIDRGGGLANAALLVGDDEYFRQFSSLLL